MSELIKMKGTLAYEILQIPGYWLKMGTGRTRQVRHSLIPYGDHSRQYIVHWTQGTISAHRPLLFYIHGGAWTFGRPEWFWAKAQFFKSQNMEVVMPSHRRLPIYHALDLRADIEQAFETAIHTLRSKGWQSNEVILGGMSSGGNLAALLFGSFEQMRAKFPDIQIKQLLFFGTPLALDYMPNTFGLRRFRRLSILPKKVSCPMTMWQSVPSIPIFAIHGVQDGLVPWRAAKPFYDWLDTEGASLNLHVLPKGTHLDSTSWVFLRHPLEQALSEFLKSEGYIL